MLKRLLYKCIRWGEWFIHSRGAVFLLPLSWIWKAISCFRHFLYDHKILEQKRVLATVVSVGNVAVGGTGKTPLVITIARQFSHRRVAIVSRGYGNDEAYVMRRHLPGAKFYENPDRVKAAEQAVKEGAELIVLDDGFQHRRLYRDFNLLIVRAKDLKGRCLPAGDLRDSSSRIKKADVLFFNDPIPAKQGIEYKTKAVRILTLQGVEISTLFGERIGVFCAIANPDRFKKTLDCLGAVSVSELILADHEPIGKDRLQSFYKKCKPFNVKYLVCTEKDAVKLEPTDLPILYVEIESVIAGGFALWQKLIAKIEERMNN